ncbi:outer membrane protein assembly factor BamB family protein [Halomicrobium mukohataei]|uniref:Serine/threonine protein kinase n=2 Tax=Halomicrobium mukohataei TaxID=57705 RepID=C7P4Z2_HALMD|nr:PQQ-binding-like beta-propeller repeat protein [Halomicrobium mukohataei]ACV49387.1 serine/threonine protein kinase [Halomicrobium mukohataei DSM 12286]QCD67215.1 serine/threonine protein kinase [Halomicrobium mukohataei]
MIVDALQRASRLRSKADSERHTVATDEIEELTALLEYRRPTAPASPAESAEAPLDDGDVRAGAALALAAVARDRPDAVVPAVDGLRQCLTDTHPGLRGNAALALAAVAEARPEEIRPAVPGLRTLLSEARTETRATVTPAEYPESIRPLVAELRSLRNDERDTARAAGAIALKNVARAAPGSVVTAVDALLTLLDEEKAATRTAAVEALKNVASERPAAIEPAVDDLQTSLDDDDRRVREAAERTLAMLDGASTESAAVEDAGRTEPNRQHQRTTTMDSAHQPDLDEGEETPSMSLDPSALRHDDVIGRTATTVVHRVRHPGEDGPDGIAVKHPARHGTLTEETIDGFDHEARQWAGLDDHPNVVSVIDWGYDPLPWLRGDASVPWIATEVVDGPDLRAVAEDATVEQSLWTAQRLVDAVWHAHHRGVVHLDLKPSNVLFAPGERWPIPKVADWELSRSLLGQGAAVGISTPGYCAPEQDGQGTTDQRTDQFQLAIVLYELFTGTHPFVDDLAATPQRERIERVLDADHRSPSERRPELPAALDDVFERALARDPADRYEATIDLRRALERIAEEWESTPDDPQSATEPATADRDPTPTTDHSAPEPTSTDRSRPTADDRDWPTLHGSASRSGPRQRAVGPSPPVTERWTFQAGDSIRGGPTVVDDTLYVGSDDAAVYALATESGATRWTYETDDPVQSPATVVDGTVYVGSHDKRVYALDAETGAERWVAETDGMVDAAPAVVDGTVYVGSYDKHVYALDAATGAERWVVETDGKTGAVPTVVDGTVYASCGTGVLAALDADSGERLWRYPTGGPAMSTPAVSDGVLYAGTNDGRVVALDADTGTERWTFDAGGNGRSAPAICGDTVYAGSIDGYVLAIDADSGTERWRYDTAGQINGAPVAADDTLLVGSWDECLYALDAATGDERWHYRTGSLIDGSPAVADGTAYVATHDGVVSALGEE